MTTPTIDYAKLAHELLSAKKEAGTTPNYSRVHGNGGLFNSPAMEIPIISAMPLPVSGLMDILPVYPTNTTDGTYGIITGQTVHSGEEPEGPCDAPPKVGSLKLCEQSARHGRFSLRSKVMNIEEAGQQWSRGEHFDYRAIGGGAASPFFSPTIPGADLNSALNSEIGAALYTMKVDWIRKFAPIIWTGNPANNSAQNGYMEFKGLEILVNNNLVDAVTNQRCKAADSQVVNINANVQTSATTVVNQIVQMYRFLERRAEQHGLLPVELVFVCRQGLFHALTDVWPCTYNTVKCTNLATGYTGFLDPTEMTRQSNDMRINRYLTIDGKNIPVIVDDAISESQNATEFTTDLWILPLSVIGGFQTLYMDYLPYNGANGPMEMAALMAPMGQHSISDNGRFLWFRPAAVGPCVELWAYTRPRLILRAPHLAARLQNVKYTALYHEIDWDTTGNNYYNGGKTVGPVISYYDEA